MNFGWQSLLGMHSDCSIVWTKKFSFGASIILRKTHFLTATFDTRYGMGWRSGLLMDNNPLAPEIILLLWKCLRVKWAFKRSNTSKKTSNVRSQQKIRTISTVEEFSAIDSIITAPQLSLGRGDAGCSHVLWRKNLLLKEWSDCEE